MENLLENITAETVAASAQDMSSVSYSITEEERRELHRQYAMKDAIQGLHQALAFVGGDMTIAEAIDLLSKRCRFADDIGRNEITSHYGDDYFSSNITAQSALENIKGYAEAICH